MKFFERESVTLVIAQKILLPLEVMRQPPFIVEISLGAHNARTTPANAKIGSISPSQLFADCVGHDRLRFVKDLPAFFARHQRHVYFIGEPNKVRIKRPYFPDHFRAGQDNMKFGATCFLPNEVVLGGQIRLVFETMTTVDGFAILTLVNIENAARMMNAEVRHSGRWSNQNSGGYQSCAGFICTLDQ
ncbi:MAG TPA: hypothetical protein DD397_00675, partial [Hyphomonas sp.]|nr:hypothetical protein [Hyphomonas sp.]